MNFQELVALVGREPLPFQRKVRVGVVGVYCMLWKKDIVYIGQSRNIVTRVGNHKWMEFNEIIWFREMDMFIRTELERQCIQLSTPRYNKLVVAVNSNRLAKAKERWEKESEVVTRRRNREEDPLETWYRLYNTPGKRAVAMAMMREK